jgi:hypothetical protein
MENNKETWVSSTPQQEEGPSDTKSSMNADEARLAQMGKWHVDIVLTGMDLRTMIQAIHRNSKDILVL